MNHTTLRRIDIARILKRHRGAKAEVARRAQVDPSHVSNWLKGRAISANLAHNAEQVALELLAKEQAEKESAGDVNGPSVRSQLPELKKSTKEE